MPAHEADRILNHIDDELAGLTPSRRLRALVAVRTKLRDMISETEDEVDGEDEEDDDDNDASLHY